MDKKTLINILKRGTENASKPGSDMQNLVFDSEFAYCCRRWDYDDGDMNSDNGSSSAKIPKADVERFLDEVLASGKGERIFDSVNAFISHARYSEGAHEDISEEGYAGKAKIALSVENDNVAYRFVPSLNLKPQVRLEKEVDCI